MTDKHRQEGSLAVLALVVLVVVAVLGTGVARMHLRGSDISAELLDQGQTLIPKNLAELGLRYGKRVLLDQNCTPPTPAMQNINVSTFGTLQMLFVDNGSSNFQITSTGSGGANPSVLTCDLCCSPPQPGGGAAYISMLDCQ